MKIEFLSAQPNEEDARLIHGWRNDPVTRQMSCNREFIEWDTFYKSYIRRYFAIAALPPQFILCDGKKAGIIFFQQSEMTAHVFEKNCEIAINIAPEYRGKKISNKALTDILPWIKRQGVDKVYALIRVDNHASIASFSHAGYSLVSHHEDLLVYSISLVDYLFERVFIIAEAGSNWHSPSGGDAQAKGLIEAAAKAGCDAVKFQIFRPETTYVANAGHADYLGSQTSIYDIFKTLSMPYEWIAKLADFCKQHHIAFMASSFSPEDFNAVDPYTNFVKIASYELTHTHLIDAAAKSGKRTFLSTGAAHTHEIDWAVDRYFEQGGDDLILMQCTAHYPAQANAMHLNAMPYLKQRYQLPVGLSDHSCHPTNAPIAAVALGACAIEKHFTLDNNLPGPDHSFAITPSELTDMVKAVRETEAMLGSYGKWVDSSENELRAFAQRRLQALREIKKGELLVEGENIAILRPGKQKAGILPKYLDELHNKPASRTIPAGDGIQRGDWQ